ncbi:Pnap_2097 family protein [Salipiger mucosus]|uniref:Uncharacterized protein n=1 Tax=Salipiger mucosus DSM 16094 TaxID=1123237 RepID=S9R038_9RHOB|nr:Pnap_2097 family protein [Salipiger mucosus]EPX85298.1 hypothetical protein Salmuc_02677 [Salipiger mucosus DSM 16094]
MLDGRADERGVAAETRQMLGMQQLCPHGISEQWLLAACGDIHWTLIASALGQDGLRFRAEDGRPLYAAFCATRLELAPTGELLGQDLFIRSEIAGLGGARTGSRHVFTVGGRIVGTLLMLSTFVTHDETGSNCRIVRARPDREGAFPAAGPDLTALAARATDVSRGLRGHRMALDDTCRIEPCPALDFNAVGLLYFPSFSRLAETAAPGLSPIRMRELVYLGNLDAGEAVHIRRTGSETTIAREDGRIIARAIEERAS